MKIERNPYFKPEESVLYCGDALYSRLQSREEPETPKGYVRTWRLQVERRGALRSIAYIRANKGRATLCNSRNSATVFHSYKEAEDMAKQILYKANFHSVSVIETLSYDFVEEDYAP